MFDFLDWYFLLHEISVKRNVLPVGGGYKESGFEKLELCKVLVKKKELVKLGIFGGKRIFYLFLTLQKNYGAFNTFN